MITLHTFGSMWGLPDPSPFVTKAEVLLKMSGVPFTSKRSNLRGAPKGKLPYIEDDVEKIADSTFIRLHLEKRHGIDFDAHLRSSEKGVAWAVEKMLEDHLYWALVYERWMVRENAYKGPRRFFDPVPALIRPFVIAMVNRSVKSNLKGHGLGRHSREEILTLGARAIDATAQVLGDNRYLLGDRACGADATVFAFMIGFLCKHFETPLRTRVEQHANVVAYCERMRKEFYS